MHQPTVRVLEIINYFAESEEASRLSDLSRELAIPKSTLLPILQTLCLYRYLEQTESGAYRPGVALFSLGTAFSGKFPMSDYVRKQLEILVETLGETCYFGVLDGGTVLYLDKVDSKQPIRMLISTGQRLPAYATGIGKALLIDYDEESLHSLYPKGLEPVTANTITDFHALALELKMAKDVGYTTEAEESMEHVRCFGVPIRKNGRIVAAISVAIPVFRYDEMNRAHILKVMQAAALQISQTFTETNAHIGYSF